MEESQKPTDPPYFVESSQIGSFSASVPPKSPPAAPVYGEMPRRRLPALAFVLVFLVGLLMIPKIAEQTAYSLNRGTERAKAEIAKEFLEKTDVEQRIPWVAKTVAPSVVSIKAIMPTRQGGIEMEGGSGVIVHVDGREGFILTNDHVIANAPYVMVRMSDGRIVDNAEVIGRDESTDLAVVRIEESHLTAIDWGDSRQIEVGEQVIAVGSPFGIDRTVTSGIISATEQVNPIPSRSRIREFLQTDAAINPGNSGGPLVNMKGELIGINTAIISQTGGSLGIGFAIPSLLARRVFEDIQRHGEVKHGWLGIYMRPTTPGLARDLNLNETKGVIVDGFFPRSPARDAGIQIGDIIVRWGNVKIEDPLHLSHLIVLAKPGDTETVEILRKGETIKLDVTLGIRMVDLQK